MASALVTNCAEERGLPVPPFAEPPAVDPVLGTLALVAPAMVDPAWVELVLLDPVLLELPPHPAIESVATTMSIGIVDRMRIWFDIPFLVLLRSNPIRQESRSK
jgi:hypothetical protein